MNATTSPSPGLKNAHQRVLRTPLLAPIVPDSTSRKRSCTTDRFLRAGPYRWNEMVDEAFYNVDQSDKQAIQERIAQYGLVTEGSIVVLTPGKRDGLHYFPDAYAFLQSPFRSRVRALCAPGVGSSALGAVGLARDVVNATNLPVAAVVSGYGMSEVLCDALGGAVFFRGVNQLEMMLEHTRRGLANLTAAFNLLPQVETYDSIAGGPALASMKSLLRDGRLKNLQLVVGHSKGNLLVSAALGELVCEKANLDRLKAAQIVLLSAITALPDIAALQIIGDLDTLGWMNSRLTIPYKGVPNAMHHLNRKLPFHLDAVSELTSI